jgi:hypothetical protein
MGVPVVTVASGGLPVSDGTAGGKPGLSVTEATNGRGTPVTKVTGGGGLPVVYAPESGGGSLSPPLDGLSGVTGAWSAGRKLLTSYAANAGAFYENISGDAQTWYDQSGNARNFTAGTSARPTATTGGPNSRACLDFDGIIDYMDASNLANFVTTADGYFIASFITDRTSSNSVNIYDNDPIFSDTDDDVGIHIKTGSVFGFNWSGGANTTAGVAISTGTIYVVEWWHTGGVLSFRVNGGTTNTVSSGTGVTLGTLRIGKCRAGATGFLDGRLFELVSFNVAPASGVRDALMTNLKTYCGA